MKYFILVAFALTHSFLKGQNTFPSTGNVGINLGSSTSSNKLQLGPNLQNWSGNDLVVSNSTGSIAIHNQAGESYIYGTQTISLRPGFGQPSLYAISNGSVGIGTSTPQKRFEALSTSNDFASIGSTLTVGQYTGLHFGYLETNNTAYRKSALVFERVDGAARGKIHLLNNSGNDNTSATLADSKMAIDFTGYVGIGTTSPLSKMHINSAIERETLRIYKQGNTTNYLNIWQGTGAAAIDPIGTGNLYLGYDQSTNVLMGITGSGVNSGNVGIGTVSPVTKLDVNGAINLQNNNNITWGGAYGAGIPTIAASLTSGIYFYPAGSTSGASMRIASNGNVGIGSSIPTQKLTVNGTIYGKEVKVDLSVPGPDYVFDEDYKLTPLEDIRTYIDQNKHLPEVPSAKEMEKNGIQLGEMNMLLLKKIEELTLHVIEQNKKLNSQNELITKQNDRITKLENLKQN